MLQEMVRKFAEKELRTVARELDVAGEFRRSLFDKMAELGLTGLNIPEEYGGNGLGYDASVIMLSELARVMPAAATWIGVHQMCATTILKSGTEEQKRRFLPRLASGETLGAWALSEPGGGTDVAAMVTHARRAGDRYILNGQKMWITNAGEAEVYVVFVKTDPAKGAKGVTAFILEKGTPGFEFGRLEDKMGVRASPTRALMFDECAVPAGQRLGDEGAGFKVAMKVLDAGRCNNAAVTVGIARGALEEAVRYAHDRKAFGQSISDFQGIQWMLADMGTGIETAWALTEKTAYLLTRGQSPTKLCSMAKYYAADVAMKVTTDAVQIHGGYGYIKEYHVEMLMRDAKLFQIVEGTNQLHRNIVAKHILG